jgi:hypothetical protein
LNPFTHRIFSLPQVLLSTRDREEFDDSSPQLRIGLKLGVGKGASASENARLRTWIAM